MKPHLSVSDITLSWLEFNEIVRSPSKIHISWRIHNKSRLKIFGKDVTKLHTMYWLEKIADKDWVYQGTLTDLPFLPKNGDWLQTVHIDRNSFDEGKYILTLHFSSDNLPIGGCQNEIIYGTHAKKLDEEEREQRKSRANKNFFNVLQWCARAFLFPLGGITLAAGNLTYICMRDNLSEVLPYSIGIALCGFIGFIFAVYGGFFIKFEERVLVTFKR